MNTLFRGRIFRGRMGLGLLLIAGLVIAFETAQAEQYNFTCNSCHGMPPLDAGTRDPGTGGFQGNHQTHQPANAAEANCALCHLSSGFTNAHRDSRISFTVNINNSPLAARYSLDGTALSFKNQTTAPVLGSCSNVNCHFETATPTWGAGPLSAGDPTDCATCHQMPPTSNSHAAHVPAYGNEASCGRCHPDHTSDTNHFQHATSAGNRPIAVIDNGYSGSNGMYLPSQSASRVLGSCSAASCHSNPYGTGSVPSPVWGAGVGCAACHTGTPGSFQANGAPATGSHGAHMAVYGASCAQCHEGTVSGSYGGTYHADGKIDVTNGYPATAKHPAGTYTGTCSTASCHDNPYGTGSVTTPVWGSPVGCAACHLGTPGAFQPDGAPATGSHGAHMALSGAACGQCHEGAVKGTSGGLSHTNGNVDVSNDYTGNPVTKHMPGTYGGTCLSASCHANPYGTGTVESPVWGTTTGCASCHNGTGAFGANGAPATGSHAKHMTSTGAACDQCHAGAVSGTDGGATHTNGLVEVTGGYTASPVAKHPIGTYGGTCTTTTCHSDGNGTFAPSPRWGVAMPVNCTGCHGGTATVTPASAILATGKHRAHMNNYSTLGKGNNLKCAECHAKTVSLAGNTVITNGANHVNSFKDYSGTKAGGSSNYAAATGVCSNVYCHSSGQERPQFRNMTGSKAWRGSARLDCNGCHGDDRRGVWNSGIGAPNYPNRYDGTIATANSHERHIEASGMTDSRGCAKCHRKTVNGMANKFRDYSTSHLNRMRDVSFAIYGNYSATTKSCTTYCHSNVQAPGGEGPATVHAKPAWGGDAMTCAGCHKDMAALTETPENLALGSHKRHTVDSTYSCSICHDGGYTGTTADSLIHADGRIDVIFTGKGANTTYSQPAGNIPGDGYGTCSTSKCHGRATRNWGISTTLPTCEKCHGTAQSAIATGVFKDTAGNPASSYVGTHVSHLAGSHNLTAPLQCRDCHLVPASVDSFGHMSSLPARITWGTFAGYSSIVRGGANALMTPTYSGGTSRTCNNTYCHAGVQIKDPNTGIVSYQGAKPNPSWNDTAYLGGTGCNTCHGYPPQGTHTSSTNCYACHSHVEQSNLMFADKSRHINRRVETTADDCLDCHSSVNECRTDDPYCINKKLVGAHITHTNVELFLAGKKLSANDYIDTTWIYGIIYKKGFPQFGCGFCHEMDVAKHKNGIIEVDMDPTRALRGSVKTKNLAGGPWIVSRTIGQSVVCNNVYCHSSGYVSPATNRYQFQQTPDWYYSDNHNGASPWDGLDRCAQCHGNSPNTGGKEGSSAHARHVVANHFKDVFDGYSSKLRYAGGPGSGAVHGDPATSTNFNCNICHFNTVRVAYNDKGSVCIDCHTNGISQGVMVVYSSSTLHVNGEVDVAFLEPFNFKSKAQLRDDIRSVQSIYTSWTRVKGYKTYSSYDLSRTKPGYVGGTCTTTACHNGTQMEWRAKGPLPCAACHTELPQ